MWSIVKAYINGCKWAIAITFAALASCAAVEHMKNTIFVE